MMKKKESTEASRVLTLLVIDGDKTHNWCDIISTRKLADGSRMRVVQASWLCVACCVYPDGACVTVAPIRDSDSGCIMPATEVIRPDFALIRNQPRGVTPTADKRNVLFGLMAGNVPSINTLQSIYLNLERPLMFGALKRIATRVGKDAFPLVRQTYYSNHRQMVISGDIPSVCKIGHAHAGMGKIKLNSQENFRDVATIIAMYDDYCTCEPFIESSYGVRVQKIGPNYRVYRKNFTGSGWKSQFGGSDLVQIPLTEQYKRIADECAAECGMDLLAVDLMVAKEDEKPVIIELNGTAIGIQPQHWKEDSEYIIDLVVERMNSIYCKTAVKLE